MPCAPSASSPGRVLPRGVSLVFYVARVNRTRPRIFAGAFRAPRHTGGGATFIFRLHDMMRYSSWIFFRFRNKVPSIFVSKNNNKTVLYQTDRCSYETIYSLSCRFMILAGQGRAGNGWLNHVDPQEAVISTPPPAPRSASC